MPRAVLSAAAGSVLIGAAVLIPSAALANGCTGALGTVECATETVTAAVPKAPTPAPKAAAVPAPAPKAVPVPAPPAPKAVAVPAPAPVAVPKAPAPVPKAVAVPAPKVAVQAPKVAVPVPQVTAPTPEAAAPAPPAEGPAPASAAAPAPPPPPAPSELLIQQAAAAITFAAFNRADAGPDVENGELLLSFLSDPVSDPVGDVPPSPGGGSFGFQEAAGAQEEDLAFTGMPSILVTGGVALVLFGTFAALIGRRLGRAEST